ncbi:organic radical activating enzyme [Saprospira grandis DSM 2844]|uniref:7-carboxy-7-deazaguanine synthase n=1 Tax=Saprospira grandis DSM 2844 TaxID=694433 RepID=J0P8V6_9BACT|nr:7-carboxy-7-deazaguanine synthase QueE [Saprospira grandis]EJF53997.1 organic radical activating enzyme [Saprospira grandis DSM 2844]
MSTTPNLLAVSEYFYSLQGEGQTMGVPAIFLRLSGCNLICGGKGAEKDGQLHDGASWICDTMEVWMKGESLPFAQLLQRLDDELQFSQRLAQGVHLVITGGEPLLQDKRIAAFLAFLEAERQGLRPIIEVETNGCFLPSAPLLERVSYWNCSPKLQNSGMPAKKRIVPKALKGLAQEAGTIFKFVIAQASDFEEIQSDFLAKGLIKKEQLVLMPAADSLAALLERNKMVAEICIREQIRMSSRLHVEIWDQLTGV